MCNERGDYIYRINLHGKIKSICAACLNAANLQYYSKTGKTGIPIESEY